jgi:hypothetical protein
VSSRLGSLLVRVDELSSAGRVPRSGRRRCGRGGSLLVLLVAVALLLGLVVLTVGGGPGMAGREGRGLGRRRLEAELGEVGRSLGLGRSVGLDDVIMESVLDVCRLVLSVVESLKGTKEGNGYRSSELLGAQSQRLNEWIERRGIHLKVGIVLGEHQLGHDARSVDKNDASISRRSRSGRRRAVEMGSSERLVVDLDRSVPRLVHPRASRLLLGPGPGVSEPELRDDVEVGRLRSSVVGRDSDGDAVGSLLVL